VDIDKTVVLCHECGKPVKLAWQLYCDDCYSYLVSEKVSEAGQHDDIVVAGGKAFDSETLLDRRGKRYVFNGKAWVRMNKSKV